jgi:hypothetical protein
VSFTFDPQRGLIIVRAELWGPSGSGVLRFALDTGATGTVVNVGLLVAIGYESCAQECDAGVHAPQSTDGLRSIDQVFEQEMHATQGRGLEYYNQQRRGQGETRGDRERGPVPPARGWRGVQQALDPLR